MMFALGFVWMFMIGGFSGIMHSAAPADAQQNDSYFVIAHFHYVLIGGSIFALLAGLHYWFPLMFGRKVSEFWGKLSFLGHLRRLQRHVLPDALPRLERHAAPHLHLRSQPRLGHAQPDRHARLLRARPRHDDLLRRPRLDLLQGREGEEGLLGRPHARVVARQPAARIQFSRSSPPSTRADAWWYEKHHKEEIAKEKAEHAKAEADHGGIHMPFGSIWPFVASVGLLIAAVGITVFEAKAGPGIGPKLGVSLVGGIVTFIGIYFWSLEGNEGYHLHLDKDGNVIEDDHHAKH